MGDDPPMERTTPASLYCLLVGGALVLGGVLGFFYESSFASGEEIVSDEVLGLLAVNGWHNIVHMTIGALLLIAAGGLARPAALIVGALYLALAILGFFATGGDGIGVIASDGALVDLVPVNDEDNVFHLVLGLTGLIAGAASGGQAAPNRRQPAEAAPKPS